MDPDKTVKKWNPMDFASHMDKHILFLGLFAATIILLLMWVILFRFEIIFFIFLLIATAVEVYFMARHRFAFDFTFLFFGSILISRLYGFLWVIVFIVLAYIIPFLASGAMIGPEEIVYLIAVLGMSYIIGFFPGIRFQLLAVAAVMVVAIYDFTLDQFLSGDIPKAVFSTGIWFVVNLTYAIGFGRFF